MGEGSAIEWTDHTFNPWWGCAKVSPGCDHCYAERDAARYGHRTLWGVDAQRRQFGTTHWEAPRKWDRKAREAGRRARVFCASMADVFDKNAPYGARDRLWTLIERTPNLDWLLLTKRIGNAKSMLPAGYAMGLVYRNLWLGISVVNQEEADRDIPKLLATPAAIRFLSCEPLLGLIDLHQAHDRYTALRGPDPAVVDWVIVGGESGHKARPMEFAWADYIRRDCEGAGIAFFMKQGSQANWQRFKDFASFPEYLQVRQWPDVA